MLLITNIVVVIFRVGRNIAEASHYPLNREGESSVTKKRGY